MHKNKLDNAYEIDDANSFGLTFRNMDKIQDIMDDVAEQLQVSNEMSDLISSPIGGGTAQSFFLQLCN